jgi:hypothetical protein
MKTYSAKNWINDAFVSSASLSISFNPATYECIGEYPDDGGAAAGSAIDDANLACIQVAMLMRQVFSDHRYLLIYDRHIVTTGQVL